MSEGPQVKLRTEWLARHLTGKRADRVFSGRPKLLEVGSVLSGQRIEQCTCKGKHIFISFDNGRHLHNHLLMRGQWRKMKGPFLFAPDGIWLMIEVGSQAICNINGQVLNLLDDEGVRKVRDTLGPDILAEPYPEEEIAIRLRSSRRPVSEAIMDQSIISGIGNVAKSESLYLAGIDPRQPANQLEEPALLRLIGAMRSIMLESYTQGGRWIHRVYHQAGKACPACGHKIATIRMPPTKRTTFFCSYCQCR